MFNCLNLVKCKKNFRQFFSCFHELASTWTHGRLSGLPTLLLPIVSDFSCIEYKEFGMWIIPKSKTSYSPKGLKEKGGERGGLAMIRATCYLCLQGRKPLKGGGE